MCCTSSLNSANQIVRKFFYLVYGVIIRHQIHWLMVLLYSYVIKERYPDGKLGRFIATQKDNKITILALWPDHFRGDLEVLVSTGEFRVLQIPIHWQTRLIYQYYPKNVNRLDIHNPSPDDPLYKNKKELQCFLTEFLSRLFKKFNVDCVIGSHIEHRENLDWGEVSNNIGVPYIVFHRENLIASANMKKKVMNRVKRLAGCFKGSHVVVHNEVCRQIYVDIGFLGPDRISALGCLRMDNFIKKVHQCKTVTNRRKKVAIFPFYLSQFRDDSYSLYPFFREVYTTLINFANKHSEIDVVIKPKNKKEYTKLYEMLGWIIEGTGITFEKIPNLYITSDLDAQELLFETDVVCGLRSTVLLEAAIAGKPVIMPYFKELQAPKYDDYIIFRELLHLHLFDIAKDVNELESIIIDRLHNPTIDEKIMEERNALFEKYVSSMKGDATEKYVALIKSVVAEELKRAC